MRTIVSLLSEQPIPNLLFIKHIGQSTDQHIFISTKIMEEKYKSVNLAQVLDLSKERYKVIIVEPYSPEDILLQLDLLIGETITNEWIINLTGGTKIMSQMVYTVFSEVQYSSIFYWPDTNDKILELHPYIKEIPITNTPLINLSDYLYAHGFSYTHVALENTQDSAEYFWKKLAKAGDVKYVPELQVARSDNYKKEDKPYLTGGWFEEWLYYRLKDRYNLQSDQIGLSVQIHDEHGLRPETASRELDVVYVKDHRLYMWEAKVYGITFMKYTTIMNDLFKLSAARNMLGLKATAYFAIASNLGKDPIKNQNLNELRRTLNIEAIKDLNTLKKEF